MSLKPRKSSETKFSMRSPVFCSRVRMVQAAAPPASPLMPPSAYDSLILAWCGSDITPSPMSQAGISTHESRGMDTTVAHSRFSAMCRIIRVSERMPSTAP